MGEGKWDQATIDIQSSHQGGQDLGSKDGHRAIEAMQRIIEEECKAEILQQIHEEIEEETGLKVAHKELLRRYQPTMIAFMLQLDKKELQDAQAKAEKWTN
ncbi:hypothetical protein BDR04DRAFT_1116926 [Suillus decipiens]|nr:hypothetical protein BDR04DRAFT_1116926 [Suillus decipiens]